jgi:hypothetical protein
MVGVQAVVPVHSIQDAMGGVWQRREIKAVMASVFFWNDRLGREADAAECAQGCVVIVLDACSSKT